MKGMGVGVVKGGPSRLRAGFVDAKDAVDDGDMEASAPEPLPEPLLLLLLLLLLLMLLCF